MTDSDYRPDEESEELGRKLAGTTIEDLRGQKEYGPEASPISLERHAKELGIVAPLHDVTFVMEQFASQLEWARELDGRMPCAQIADSQERETVPLSLPITGAFFGAFSSWRWMRLLYGKSFFYEAYRDALRRSGKSQEIILESTGNVLEHMHGSLGSFLAYRISGFQAWTNWVRGAPSSGGASFGGQGGGPPSGGGGSSGSGGSPPPSSSPVGGVGVEFSCNTPGLTIEFSHSYFLHFLNFGAPSFPVKNTLMAGRYIFKGTGPTYPSGTVHSQIFRIPPDYKAVTTLF